jgi:uncharacterized protein YcbX
MPTLDRITIFPVKSLDGLDVDECRVLPCGAIEHDRRWQLVDMEGRVVNAKQNHRFHAIRAGFDLASRTVTLARAVGPGETFPLVPGPAGPCGWLSAALGVDVLLVERADGGFPDDREAPGPTLVSMASLVEVARWFGLDLAEVRRRFRANLEIGGCDAFWEDTLASPARPEFASAGLAADLPADPYATLPPPEPREFAIGEVRFRATGVCRRCVVPSCDSRTGEATELFREVFAARRRRSLRPDVDAAAWGTFERLAVNTRVTRAGWLRPGLVLTTF